MSENRIGIIGGTGLYDIEGFREQKWLRLRTPYGEPSDAFLLGELAGRELVFLPRHGRGHRISPSELNHRANIWAMRKLGVRWIISVSAVGSLRARYRPCDVVLPNQYFDRTKQSTAHSFFGGGIVAHVAFADPVSLELHAILYKSAKAARVRVHKRGTYVNMEGPAFSTRAESLANRRLGFDVIGMTSLGEAKCAREAGIAYATMAMITDYDCWKEDGEHVTVDVVMENVHANAATAKAIIQRTVPQIPSEPIWPCHSSLKNAILTDRKAWPARKIRELGPIIEAYL